MDQRKSIKWQNKVESENFLRTALNWTSSVTPRVLKRCAVGALYCGLTTFIWKQYLPEYHLPITPFEYSGVFLGLLLVFRINAGYDRWWEARKVWGGIVNQSRNLAINICSHSNADNTFRRALLELVAQWPYAMKEHLRDSKQLNLDLPLTRQVIGPEFAKTMDNTNHHPNSIGYMMAVLLGKLKASGMNGFSFLNTEQERMKMTDYIGMCERIKKTPVPFVFAVKLRRFIVLFLGALPFALFEHLGIFTPLIFSVVAYALFSLDQIGYELQDPFSEKNLSHLPLNDICHTIQANVEEIEALASGVDNHHLAINLERELKWNMAEIAELVSQGDIKIQNRGYL